MTQREKYKKKHTKIKKMLTTIDRAWKMPMI